MRDLVQADIPCHSTETCGHRSECDAKSDREIKLESFVDSQQCEEAKTDGIEKLENPIVVFDLLIKHDGDACACEDANAVEVCSHPVHGIVADDHVSNCTASNRGNECDDDYSQYVQPLDRKSTRLNSSHVKISYAVFCL